ncbi:MAG TPA: AbfB domain-containing protein, partial [Roseimicrobium sp.]|nr:AbfB domain-containing protein [Roseimicrobium sp.]
TLHYALLNKDMISLKDLNGDGKITEGADIFSKIEIKDRPMGFGEAPWLYKSKGKYYLVDAMSMPQQVAYAMADSPRGPWQYKGVILNENRRPDGSQGDFNSDTSHPAVIEFKGQWYVFYHNAAQPTGGQSRRSVCVEKISYNADGTIAQSFISSTGPLDGAVRIQSGRQADQYVTFSGFDVKLDTLPADDRTFRWDVTQGLADEATPGTVSMQSVTYPGYYLTVKGDAVVLEKNDASADFRRRATFKKIPVPSDKKLTALQSLADPSRYLRRSADTGKLTAEIITSATNNADKSEATFKFISDADAY